jgi:hypothetical protein
MIRSPPATRCLLACRTWFAASASNLLGNVQHAPLCAIGEARVNQLTFLSCSPAYHWTVETQPKLEARAVAVGGAAMTEEKKASLQAYLAEYASLRQEVTTRLQTLHQAFNYVLIVFGAAVTAIVAASQHDMVESASLIVALFLPIVTAPLAFIYFDQEITMDGIWSHIHGNLRPHIIALTGETDILGNIWDFKYMHSSTWKVYHKLLIGRWLLFLVPTLLPLSYLVAFAATTWDSWRTYITSDTPAYFYVVAGFCGIIVLIDVLVVFHLVRTVAWTFRKWDSPQERSLCRIATHHPPRP